MEQWTKSRDHRYENHVWDHWTVIESISEKQARLFDSLEIARIDRKRCTTGKRNRNKTYSLGVANTSFYPRKARAKKGEKQTEKEAMQMKKKTTSRTNKADTHKVCDMKQSYGEYADCEELKKWSPGRNTSDCGHFVTFNHNLGIMLLLKWLILRIICTCCYD